MKQALMVIFYILVGLAMVLGALYVVGYFLPEERAETRSATFNAPPKAVYAIVTDNTDYSYRSGVREIKIVEKNGDLETWDEVADLGAVVRFKTRLKEPPSRYEFDFWGMGFSGHGVATFEAAAGDRTLLAATETIRVPSPLLRPVFRIFFNTGKYMEDYQADLGRKVDEQREK